nr:retrovirus-related Pol polyprotein from transposon TNT 1-94 [Tanacetum cinerariifolium]
IIPLKDNLYNGRKGIGFENYEEKVIGLGYTLMFLTHYDEALEIEKFKRSTENKIEFAYDYGNLNASYVNEKINFRDDYFQDIINPNFEKIDSPFHVSNLNKNVKRYSRKDLLACNNSLLGETSSAYVCNDTMNVSCNPRMCDLLDDNNFFIFDDVNVRISPVSKMPFRKKLRDSMHVHSKSNMNKSLPITVHKWLPKLQPLAEPLAKWFPRMFQICLWIIDLGCSKHITGNRALLTNFVEKFLGTVRFGTNDFAVIAGYGDVVIGSMTIKKVYYVEGLGHNLFSVGQFCLPKMKFEKDHLCSACEQRKIHRKHHKSKTTFASNKPLYLLHIDLCGPMRVQSINGKRYVLVVVDDYSRYTGVFFLHSKHEASDVIISFIEKTQGNLQLQVQRVRTDNDTEFKNKTLAKFFDEVGISQQFSAARTPQQNGIVERRNRTLVEAARTDELKDHCINMDGIKENFIYFNNGGEKK